MPYLIFGIVESIFVDEEKNEKTKEYGCAILIDSNVILLPSKNLIFDNQSFENESLNIPYKKKINPNNNNSNIPTPKLESSPIKHKKNQSVNNSFIKM